MTTSSTVEVRAQLRVAVNDFYDLQKLRIQFSNRAGAGTKALITDDARTYLKTQSERLRASEDYAQERVLSILKPIPIYKEWLKDQRGVGPLLAGVLLAYIDIDRAATVSNIYSLCGLSVFNGKSVRRVKGQRAAFNPWLKSKIGYLMPAGMLIQVNLDDHGYFLKGSIANPKYVADSVTDSSVPELVIRCGHDRAYDQTLLASAPCWQKRIKMHYGVPPEEIVWRKFYDDYKHRKAHQLVPVCMACGGTGKYTASAEEHGIADEDLLSAVEVAPKETPSGTCANCGGSGVNAPWGRSTMHRHVAALRYCAKQFLAELYKQWRTIEGLPVRVPYAEEYLGRVHHAADR